MALNGDREGARDCQDGDKVSPDPLTHEHKVVSPNVEAADIEVIRSNWWAKLGLGQWASLNNLGHILALVALLGYIPGLLVVNMYLFRLGVADFAILRTRFLMTGFLATLPLLLILYLLLSLAIGIRAFIDDRPSFRTEARRERWRSIWSWFVLVILYLFTLGLLFLTLVRLNLGFRSDILSSIGPNTEVILLLLILAPNIITFVIPKVYDSDAWKHKDRPLLILWSIVYSSLLMISFMGFLYLDFFTSTIFPVVPEQFGGGRPKEITIVLSSESDSLGAELGFTPSSSGLPARNVDLLWETEQMYVVRDRAQSETQAIQIAREAVSAIIYDPGKSKVATPIASPVPIP